MGWLRRVPVLDSAVPMLCPSYSGVPTGDLAQALSTWGLRKVEPGQAGNGAAQMPRNREFLERRAEQRLPACRRAYLDCTAHSFFAPAPVVLASALGKRTQRIALSCPVLAYLLYHGRPASVLLLETALTAVRPATLRGGQMNLPLHAALPPFLKYGGEVAEWSKALRSGRSLLCGRRFESCPVHHFCKNDPRGIRTPSLWIWNPTRCRCAMESLHM